MTGTIYALLLQQSELGAGASLWGRSAARHFGKPFDRLLAKGILCEQAPAETWGTCRYCTCDYDHRLIREINGRLLAMCPWDHKADDELEPDDLRSFAIRREKLIDLIRVANDLGPATSEIMPGLWRIGETKGRRTVLIALDRQALAQPGLMTVIKAGEQARDVTLLSPELPTPEAQAFRDAGITPVVLAKALSMSDAGWPVLDMAMLEPDLGKPRLVIETALKRAALDGRVLKLSDQLFSLLSFLADRASAGSGTIDNRDIEDYLWGEGIHRISSQVREPVRALRRAFSDTLEDPEAGRGLVENRSHPNGYRLALSPSEIEING